jgi:hypothetical protein
MHSETECTDCGYVWSKPQPWALCPGCGADAGRARTHRSEPDHELAGAVSEHEEGEHAEDSEV